MKHQSGGDLSGGGQFLDEPGSYHFLIDEATETVTKRDGSLIDNAAFRVVATVLAGTTAGQEQKKCNITFFHPKATGKNEGAFARKKMDRFFVATNALTPAQVESKAEVDLDLEKILRGKQFVAKMEKSEDGKYVEIAFSDVYHVDDLEVKAIPKDAELLALIPARFRWPGGKPPGSNGAAPAAAPTPTTTATATKSDAGAKTLDDDV